MDAIDLKLLSVFEAVITEASFSRAAKRLGMTQSAVSQAIARLRPIVHDELFERTGRGVRPTPRACELQEPFLRALALLRLSLNSTDGFDPVAMARTFFIAMRADVAEAFAVKLYETMPARSQSRLYVVPASLGGLETDLRYGEPELAVLGETIDNHGFRNELLYSEGIVMLARRGHPGIRTPLTWENYASLGHVVLSRSGPTEASPIDLEFKRRGEARHVPLSMPTPAAVVRVAEQTDLVCTIGRRLAHHFASQQALEIHELPVPELNLPTFMVWHERFDLDRGHQWLRGLLRKALKE